MHQIIIENQTQVTDFFSELAQIRVTMDTTTLEHEMLNCPDCQLQTLQQQQQEELRLAQQQELRQTQKQNQVNEKHQHISVGRKDHGQSQNSGPYVASHHQTIVDPRFNVAASSSSVTLANSSDKVQHQNFPYRNTSASSTSGYHTGPCGGQTLPIVSNSIPPNPTVGPGPPAAEMYPSGNLTPLPMEGCDISGYCATCAVLDLPANDKYYRSSLSRHSVFPSMFYSQPPPIPGFSPVPDCNPWTNSNEYGPYSYTSAYQQPQQSTSTEYYNNCSSAVASSQPHSESPSQVLSSCSYTFPPASTANASEDSKKNMSKKEPEKSNYVEANSVTIDDDSSNAMPICMSSSSEDSSDSGSYISQREVIVEDEDENDDGSVSMSICNIARNQRCVVCQIPVMADCSSPQLVNILENIHEDITAEDLDITVSSGDIEIGGIEDEVRDFHQPKKSAVCQITFDRLSFLLNVPVKVFLAVHECSTDVPSADVNPPPDPDAQIAPLCGKCGKLAGTIDALDKQFRANCVALKQILESQVGPVFDKPTNKPTVSNTFDKNSSGKSDLSCFERSFHESDCLDIHKTVVKYVSAVTQTEPCDISPEYTVALETSKSPAVCKHGNPKTLESVPSPKNLINFRDIRLEYANVSSGKNMDEDTDKCYQSAERSMENLSLIAVDSNTFPCSIAPIKEKELEVLFPDHTDTPEEKPTIWLSPLELDRRADVLCEECGSILGCWKSFEVHWKRHHNELRYGCADCLKCFPNEASLQVHVRSHTGEKPYECTQCHKKFSTNSNLKAHNDICQAKRHKKDGQKTLMADFEYNKIQNSGEKFTCEVCGISFRLKERFDSHKKKDCAAKVLECSHCQKKFAKQSELKVHLLTHDGKKQFVCDVCGLSFATKGNQVAHSRIHSDEKRFKCNICDKGFNRKQALQLHVNRHNGKGQGQE